MRCRVVTLVAAQRCVSRGLRCALTLGLAATTSCTAAVDDGAEPAPTHESALEAPAPLGEALGFAIDGVVAGEMELIDTAYTESFDGACTTHILAIWLRAGAYQLKVQLASIDTPLVSGTYPQAVNRCGERKVRTIATLHHVLDDGSGTQLLGVARQESAFALPELERDPASGELAFRLELRDIIFEPVAELADQHPAEAAVEHTISATIETRVPITRLDNRPR